MNKLVVAFTLLCVLGCSPKVVQYTNLKDTLYIDRVETITDTVYNISLPEERYINTTSDTISILETKVAKSKAVLTNGLLTHTLENKEDISVKEQVKSTTIERVRIEKVPIEVEIIKTVYPKWLVIVSIVAFIYLTILVLLFLKK